MTSREQSQKLTSIASSPLCYAISASFSPQKCQNGAKIVMKLHFIFVKYVFFLYKMETFIKYQNISWIWKDLKLKMPLLLGHFGVFREVWWFRDIPTSAIRPKKCEFNKDLATLCPSNTRRALHKCERKMRSRKTLITLEKHLFVDICIPHAQRKSTVYRCPIILSHWTCISVIYFF